MNDDGVRYARHLMLEEIGPEGQARIRAASVLAIGAGGLGSPALMYLAAAGVGRLGVVDDDVVELSNLQRQILHDTPSLGQPKASVAVRRIGALNPGVVVESHATRLSADNALDLIGRYDVVLDGTDNFPTRYCASDACEILGKPYIYGSVFRFEGQASVFGYRGGPGYRDLFPVPPPPGSVPTCGEAGVLGVVPGLIGLIMATETLKVLAGFGETLSGRLLLVDAATMSFRELRLDADPGRARVTALTDYDALCGLPKPTADRLTPREVVARRAEGWRPFVVDVRRPNEVAAGSLDFVDAACPHDEVATLALPEGVDVLLLCRSGARSSVAAATVRERGHRAYDVAGGLLAWRQDVDPQLPVV